MATSHLSQALSLCLTGVCVCVCILKTDPAALTRIQWGPREIRGRFVMLYILLYRCTPLQCILGI